jgi:two-component system, OmpR family, phosphate regulon sensor histidine kinase PhoR
VVARCDPARIAQVLKNLISNAVKYSLQRGEITVSVGEQP